MIKALLSTLATLLLILFFVVAPKLCVIALGVVTVFACFYTIIEMSDGDL